jgi:hypothetical protein
MLEEEFRQIAFQMRSQLEKARTRFTHPVDKGSSAEESFRSFLREYLPRRLAIGNGEVVDSNERRSAQVDVVIVSEDHPFTFTENLPGLFFVEGVTGAGEVKSLLTRDHLEQAINNSRKFKQLSIDIGAGTIVRASPEDLKRYYEHPPYFLFAYESQLSIQTIFQRLQQEENTDGSARTDLLDAVYVLGKGWLVNFGDGKGSFQFISSEKESLAGWQGANSEDVLLPLMAWLSHVMPRFQRYLPILNKYLIPSNPLENTN